MSIKLAIAGLGTVGVGLIKLLADSAAQISGRVDEAIEVVAVSSRDKNKDRGIDISGYEWCDNPLDLVNTDADIVVELIGGEAGIALDLTKAALSAGKDVVTANKAMLAYHGGELATLAEENGVSLAYEAAVAGGIPVIKSLREGFAGNEIKEITGILNGTCNYILTEMEATGREFADILKDAQEKGYAEADPELDVGGGDAAHKLAILAANAFAKNPNFKDLYVEGIEKITPLDIELAKKLGFKIKHLCYATSHGEVVEQRAHPTLIPLSEKLAGVDGVFNAVEINADPVGQSVLIGRGAGAGPTASAVAADIIDIANSRITHVFNVPSTELGDMKVASIDDIESEYYLRLEVEDHAGVLEAATNILKEEEISVRKLLQEEPENEKAQIVVITHEAKEAAMKKTIEKLSALDSVRNEPQMIRILS